MDDASSLIYGVFVPFSLIDCYYVLSLLSRLHRDTHPTYKIGERCAKDRPMHHDRSTFADRVQVERNIEAINVEQKRVEERDVSRQITDLSENERIQTQNSVATSMIRGSIFLGHESSNFISFIFRREMESRPETDS